MQNSPKNILILLPTDSMGGAEQYLKMVASFYKEAVVKVFFLQTTGQRSWDGSMDHIHLHYPKSNNKALSVARFLFNSDHRNIQFHYIFTSHVYTTGLIGIMLRLGLIRTTYFVARESTSIFLRFKGIKLLTYKLFYTLGYKKVDLLICQTQLMKDQLLQGFSSIEKITKVKVIPNPIDFSLIKEREKDAFPEKLPEKYIVSAGRLIPEKGYDILIKSFSALKSNFPELKLVILGDGHLKGELSQLVASLGLEEDVLFKGFVGNVYPYFKRATVCVVASRMEGFPNVLLQMMSQNPRVVSTTCAGGISEIPGISISETNSVSSLTRAIKTALESETDHSAVFNDFLKQRDISTFTGRIEAYLDNS